MANILFLCANGAFGSPGTAGCFKLIEAYLNRGHFCKILALKIFPQFLKNNAKFRGVNIDVCPTSEDLGNALKSELMRGQVDLVYLFGVKSVFALKSLSPDDYDRVRIVLDIRAPQLDEGVDTQRTRFEVFKYAKKLHLIFFSTLELLERYYPGLDKIVECQQMPIGYDSDLAVDTLEKVKLSKTPATNRNK